MIPYGYIVVTVARQIGQLVEDGQVSQKAKGFLKTRASVLKSAWRCFRKNCDYYQMYQAHGPAILTHIGYHSAERLALEHLATCTKRLEMDCSVCNRWATDLRGELWQVIMGRVEGKKFGFH